jgi:hypothetical protein
MDGIILFLSIIIFILLPAMAVKIIRPNEKGVVYRLGRKSRTLGPGLNLIIPLLERVERVHGDGTPVKEKFKEEVPQPKNPPNVWMRRAIPYIFGFIVLFPAAFFISEIYFGGAFNNLILPFLFALTLWNERRRLAKRGNN